MHIMTGTQWLHSRVMINSYEEFSGTEYRYAGCTEEYISLDRDLEQAGEIESLKMEADVGGGLAIKRICCCWFWRVFLLFMLSQV